MSQSADDIPAAIEWHEGMMLVPQHFQVNDRRQEQLQAFHAHQLQPYYWGVRTLSFDEVLLVEGQCRVVSFEAVMPDGTPVAHTAGERGDLEVSLAEHEEEARVSPLTIHVALPVPAEGGGSDTPDRYTSADGPRVTDQVTGDRSVRIPRRVPRLRLLVAETPPSQYTSLPIARVEYSDDGFSLVDYEPPRLDVPPDSEIGGLCKSMLAQVRKKAGSLADRIQSSAVETGSAQELAEKRKVQALVSAVPAAEAQLRSGEVHPFRLYQTLCRMAGDVAGLTERMVPPLFSAYDHADLRASYAEVTSYIGRALSEGVQEAYAPVPFRKTDAGFALSIKEDWLDTDLVLGIRGRPGQEADALRRWGEQCLIGAVDQIASMRERRILGVERIAIERAGDLVPTRGMVLFRLDTTSTFIEAGTDLVVRRGEERAEDEHPLELILFVEDNSTGE
jgi:type VI secretion system protein ImpJ